MRGIRTGRQLILSEDDVHARDPYSRIMTPHQRAVAIAGVVLGSLLVGGIASPAQQFLPDALRSFANSAGSWTMFAFLFVWLTRARPLGGAVLGAVSFVLMVEAYGVVSAWRGFGSNAPFSTSWTIIALVAGPVIGVAATLVRHGSRGWTLAGVGVLSLVLIAEGGYGLTVIGATTSPVYWWLEVILGVAFLPVTFLRTRRSPVSEGATSSPQRGEVAETT
jgi:hypothetical protein